MTLPRKLSVPEYETMAYLLKLGPLISIIYRMLSIEHLSGAGSNYQVCNI